VQEKMFFLDYAPVIFTSAKSGFQLERLLEAIRFVAANLKQKIPTAIVNRTLRDAIEARQPASSHGQRLKFYYATQVKSAPPTFLLFVNKAELFSDQYRKFLQGQLRKAFGYEGCPVHLIPKARPKTIAPIRKFNKSVGQKGPAKEAGAKSRFRPGVKRFGKTRVKPGFKPGPGSTAKSDGKPGDKATGKLGVKPAGKVFAGRRQHLFRSDGSGRPVRKGTKKATVRQGAGKRPAPRRKGA
jgi:hypothetical protein